MRNLFLLVCLVAFLPTVNVLGNNNRTFETELSKLPTKISDASVVDQYIDVLGKYGNTMPEYALQVNNRIISVAKHLNNPEKIHKALAIKGRLELLLNRQEESLISYMTALKGFRQSKDAKSVVSVLSDIARLYYRKSNYIAALEYLQEALTISKENNYWSQVASTLNNIAIIHFEYGNYDKALTLFRESNAVAEVAKDLFGTANSHIGIGNVYFEMKEYYEAEKSYKNAIKILEKSTNTLAPLAIAYSNTADVYKHLNQRDSTIHYLKLCHQIATKHFDPLSKALALQNLSEEYLLKKDYSQALLFAEMALNEYIQLENQFEISAVNLLKSNIYKAERNYPKAILHAKISNEIAQKYNLSMNRVKSLESLAELFYLTKDYRQSSDYYRRKSILNDSIMSAENINSIRNKLKQYELKVKAKEQEMLTKDRNIQELTDTYSEIWYYIVLCLLLFAVLISVLFHYYRKFRYDNVRQIELQNQIIEQKNRELIEKSKQIEYQLEILKTDNASKEKLFSVIAHDLKNPLTVVMTSADLAYSYYEKLSKEQVLGYLQKIVEASLKINGLLHNLLDWVMSQQGKIIPNREKVSVDELVLNAVSLVQSSAEAKGIQLKYLANNEFTVFVDINMIKTVLRNILTNAVKYSHSESEVNIKSVRIHNKEINGLDSTKIHLIIEDKGIGIAADKIKNIFSYSRYSSNSGSSYENGSGLGLIICKDFIEKNYGKIMIESKVSEGTKVVLELPEIKLNNQ